MPLLLSIQQTQTFWPRPPQLEPSNITVPNAVLDHQAALNLVENITASSLRALSAYLELHVERHAELQGCIGTVTQAARCFAARDYAQAFAQIYQAYRSITALREINPQLPPLRAAAMAESSSPPSNSLH
jgi:hypothetical protein